MRTAQGTVLAGPVIKVDDGWGEYLEPFKNMVGGLLFALAVVGVLALLAWLAISMLQQLGQYKSTWMHRILGILGVVSLAASIVPAVTFFSDQMGKTEVPVGAQETIAPLKNPGQKIDDMVDKACKDPDGVVDAYQAAKQRAKAAEQDSKMDPVEKRKILSDASDKQEEYQNFLNSCNDRKAEQGQEKAKQKQDEYDQKVESDEEQSDALSDSPSKKEKQATREKSADEKSAEDLSGD
ncbi:hypothetical protein Bra3105_18280 [Brachybacterium halotolerans subsp. kimchii]|uniref:hypothetical protein n=1 Tax=Brachybacterium halotolerans TaxID=2795215 RepID=UPI001E489F0F|nr:hypothetical protein [Brachybacterium halotolerans]UEJ82746.1 hypothetical protein Bra3105_18280 [Brachybacterium halotolerans subsp. kimchii]